MNVFVSYNVSLESYSWKCPLSSLIVGNQSYLQSNSAGKRYGCLLMIDCFIHHKQFWKILK